MQNESQNTEPTVTVSFRLSTSKQRAMKRLALASDIKLGVLYEMAITEWLVNYRKESCDE